MSQLFATLSAPVSERNLAITISSDLIHLINASLRGGRWQGDTRSLAFRSVLNWGNPPLIGLGDKASDLEGTADGIRAAIAMFEPRLIAASLRVTAPGGSARPSSAKSRIQWPEFHIDGVLAATRDLFHLRMRIDLIHGHAVMEV